MKKSFILMLIVILIIGTLLACGRKSIGSSNNINSETTSKVTEKEPADEITGTEKSIDEIATSTANLEEMLTEISDATKETLNPVDSWYLEQILNGNFT